MTHDAAMYYYQGSVCLRSPDALQHPPQMPYILPSGFLEFAGNPESELLEFIRQSVSRGEGGIGICRC